MAPLPGSTMLCFIFAFVTHSQGILFSLDTTSTSIYCGSLLCWADKMFSDANVFSISGLAVYDVTHANMPVKLAYLTVYPTVIVPGKPDITVTGNISWHHAELTVGLRNHSYCLNGSFLCELDFVHASGQPDVIRETVTPGRSGNCPAVFSKFADMVIQVKAHSDELEKEIAELKQQNETLKTELEKEIVELRQQNEALKAELEKALHAQQNDTHVACFKGMQHNNSREHFLLWGKVPTLCDTETDGGGWIVIQRRTKGDIEFYRNWNDYKNGFGTPDTDFWIGNDIIHKLTSQNYTELRIDMEYQGRQYYAQYSHFAVGNETSFYNLSVNGYQGTAEDNLNYINGHAFTTFDKDNDSTDRNCAIVYHGAWWYNYCSFGNLNGMWGAQNYVGVFWRGIVYPGSVSFSEIKIRFV